MLSYTSLNFEYVHVLCQPNRAQIVQPSIHNDCHFQDSFLEDINCVLNSGEVPDLFDNDDVDAIAMDLKRAAAEAEIPDTREAVFEFFIQVRMTPRSWYID